MVDRTTESLRQVRDLICDHCGVFIADTRLFVLATRLRPRLRELGCEDMPEYCRLIRNEAPEELQQAVNLVLNHETRFFREPEQLHAVVALVKNGGDARPFRVLCAGCSSGEEPYSLAMLLHEADLLGASVTIEAFDIAEPVLERAREACYGANSFRGVDAHYTRTYFNPSDGGQLLTQEMRSAVSFRRANLIDRGEAGRGLYDVVLCRNVLIYFAEDAQHRALRALHTALVPGGHLFLGHSESLRRKSDAFEIVRLNDAVAHRRPALMQTGA